MRSLKLWRTNSSTDTTLYAELVRRGLPIDYARRTADELADHESDLLADLQGVGVTDVDTVARQRMGETRRLASQIATAYRQRSWFGRWPLLSYFVLPPLALVGVWLTVFGGLGLAAWALLPPSVAEATVWRDVESVRATKWVLIAFANLLMPCLLAWFYGRLALRTTMSRGCLLSCCLMIGLLNGVACHKHRVNADDPARAMNTVGFMLGDAAMMARWYMRPVQAMQTLAPVLVGGVLLWREQRRRQQALLAPDGATPESMLAA